MTSTRDQLIETTCKLLEMQGYHATGLNQIIRESGAPRGSLYYHFPEGKEELTTEAVERSGKRIEERIQRALAENDDPGASIGAFVHQIAYYVEASEFRTGGPLMTVAMETVTTSERLNGACRAAYQRIQNAFQRKLQTSGYALEEATELAIFITAAIEGGIVLSRTAHSGEPLRRVAERLTRLLRSGS